MKKLLLALMLFPAIAAAQPSAKYQPPTPTPWFNTTPGAPAQVINAWAADQYGRVQTISKGGDAPIPNGTPGPVDLRATLRTTPPAASTPGTLAPVNANALGTLQTAIDQSFQANQANGLLKVEDTNSASGDALVGLGCVRNDGAGVLTHQDTDYGSCVVGARGAIVADVQSGFSLNLPTSILKTEDLLSGNADALVGIASRRVDSLATSSGSDGDYSQVNQDSDGRLYINPFGSDVGHTLTGIVLTPVAALTPIPVWTATASTRYYIQGWNCWNIGTTATEVLLINNTAAGTAADAIDGCWVPSNAVAQTCFKNYTGMPLRTASNQAVSVFTTTTGSSIKCKLQGYTSAN